MYNTDLPRRVDLPSSAQLARSTIIATLCASTILALVVLPAEYAIDPTGIGRWLGLTRMGEIKTQLAREASADAQSPAASVTPAPDLTARLERIERLLMAGGRQSAPALPATVEASPSLEALTAETLTEPPLPAAETIATQELPVDSQQEAAVAGREDRVSFTLAPGQGAEFKLAMSEGAVAEFAWSVEGGVVNFDTHGDGGGQNISYEKGRGAAEDEGKITAAFTGNHGWFWRNRGTAPVTVTLLTRGDYSGLERKI